MDTAKQIETLVKYGGRGLSDTLYKNRTFHHQSGKSKGAGQAPGEVAPPGPAPAPLEAQPLLRSVACVGTSEGQALEGSRPSHCSLGPVGEWQEVFNFCFITKNDS